MKYVEACLSAREDRESGFHRSGGPVRLLQACLCWGKIRQSSFNLRGSAVTHF